MTPVPSAFPARVPLTGCDGFHLALDALMRRSGQGRNVGQLVLELDGALDLARLRTTVARFVAVHPIVGARVRRAWTAAPVWELATASAGPVPIDVWREPGAGAGDGVSIAEVHAVAERRLNEPLDPFAGRNLRLDVIGRADGGSTLVVSFAHVLLDAVGAELLITELDRSADAGRLEEPVAALRIDPARPRWRERLACAAPSGRRLDQLAATRFRSLAGGRANGGRARIRVVTLDAARSAAALARAAALCGPLGTMPLFLACAARAHDAVFRARGADPRDYVVTVPVQTRARGKRGPIFQNHVSILFFHLRRADLASVEAAVDAIRAQLAETLRARLDAAFAAGLDLARRLPSRLVIAAVRQRFRGEICSFFHSYTGAFAPALATFLGVPVRNGYHTPAVAAPPGSGLFVGERGGRLNLTAAWREGVVSEDEAALLLARAADDCACTCL
jgi:hypothetical protein